MFAIFHACFRLNVQLIRLIIIICSLHFGVYIFAYFFSKNFAATHQYQLQRLSSEDTFTAILCFGMLYPQSKYRYHCKHHDPNVRTKRMQFLSSVAGGAISIFKTTRIGIQILNLRAICQLFCSLNHHYSFILAYYFVFTFLLPKINNKI